MFKKLLFLFIIFILIISCRKPFRPNLNSLGTPPSEDGIPEIPDITPPDSEEDYYIKANDTEDTIKNKIQKYYEKYALYVALIDDTEENIEANKTIEKINTIINDDIYYEGVLLDLSKTDITKIPDNSFSENKHLSSVKLPDTVTSIGVSAFSNAKVLTAINLPYVLTEIGDGAFYNCAKLKAINFPSSLKNIGAAAFSRCVNLQEVDLKYVQITILPKQVFAYCDNLSKVVLPDVLLGMENSAFRFCISLEEITLPENFVVIGNSVFSDCSKLKKVNFNDKLKYIYHYAFYGCSSLSKISLPSSLQELGAAGLAEIFPECTSLSDVEYLGTNPEDISCFGNIFGTSSNPQNLYLPNVDDPAISQSQDNWNNFLGYDWTGNIHYKTPMPIN